LIRLEARQVVCHEHEQVNLVSGKCRRSAAGPHYATEPGNRAGGVRQLQCERIGAAGWDITDREGAGSVDGLGEIVASAAVDVQRTDSHHRLRIGAGEIKISVRGGARLADCHRAGRGKAAAGRDVAGCNRRAAHLAGCADSGKLGVGDRCSSGNVGVDDAVT
jgi:hypothetical protein